MNGSPSLVESVKSGSFVKYFIINIVILLIVSLPSWGEESIDVAGLRKLIESTPPLGAMDDSEIIPMSAIDAGEATIPMLDEILKTATDEDKRMKAATALAYIGGPSAVAILKKHEERKNEYYHSLLMFALASTGLTDDRTILVKSLDQGAEYGPSDTAAYSLGLLRDKEALPELERAARAEPCCLSSEAARNAIRWIRKGSWSVHAPITTDYEKVIAAVLANGVPRTDESDIFRDTDRPGYWHRIGDGWYFERGASGEKTPSITFHTHFNHDKMRALVSVGLYFGLKNAAGYDYVLKKEHENWIIRGLLPTWMA